MSSGPRLVGLAIGDDPSAWEAAGFAVLERHVHLEGVAIRLDGVDGDRGILGWHVDGAPATSVEGLTPIEVSSDETRASHPNGVTAVDHVVVGTGDVERTTAALATLGLAPRRTVVGARDAALTYRFFLLGTCLLELIGPAEHDPDRTPRQARFAGLALVGDDLTVAERLGVTGAPKPAIQPGRQISTVKVDEFDISVPLAILTPRPRD